MYLGPLDDRWLMVDFQIGWYGLLVHVLSTSIYPKLHLRINTKRLSNSVGAAFFWRGTPTNQPTDQHTNGWLAPQRRRGSLFFMVEAIGKLKAYRGCKKNGAPKAQAGECVCKCAWMNTFQDLNSSLVEKSIEIIGAEHIRSESEVNVRLLKSSYPTI